MWSSRSLFFALTAFGLLGAASFSAAAGGAAPSNPDQVEVFEKKIRPLLVEHCFSCHGQRAQQAGLRLDNAGGFQRGADSGPVVVPGDPEHSALIRAVRYTGAIKMPPAGKLQSEEIAALEDWVRQGARWPQPAAGAVASSGAAGPAAQHWSFQPVRRPAIPIVRNRAWVKTPVDAFLLAELEKRKLTPAPPADRSTLIRRATFDLTGLPPTPEETEAFVRDRTPDAWARVVDRLLASPQYGARWGRHWLDVVRYADTAGETADYPVREAYRYRNYVVDAFNHDKPYDQFLREQIAGDLLAPEGPPECYAERVTATGFLAIARRFGFDPENYQHLTIDDTIDTLGKSILGLTLGCARCHDHKFDPIPSTDYYGLYGIFASTRYAYPGSEETKRPKDFVPLVPPAEAARLQKQFDAELADMAKETSELETERARLRARVGLDGDFELQRVGSVPVAPWVNGPNSPAVIRESAQSPFVNVYPLGTRGLAFANAAGYSGFGQPVTPRTAAGTRLLYYNVDFRNTVLTAGIGGSWRYYVGHGPGVSAAVELFVNGETLFARNGGQIEPVCGIRAGEWYNLQLVLDLREKRYSGTFGTPGNLTRISERQFALGWDGTVDYFFVDSYGHVGGVRPGHEVDNFALRDIPMDPVVRAAPGRERISAGDRLPVRDELNRLDARATDLEHRRSEMAERGPYPVAYGVTEGTPGDARLQHRGDPTNLGDVVPRHFPAVAGGKPLPKGLTGSGRLELAQWVTDPLNPLTARVIVNRVWQHHFARGIVSTPNNFGRRGAPPTHPALLDWLASEFIAPVVAPASNSSFRLHPSSFGCGWSLKKLHRLILLSNCYQMSCTPGPRAAETDPENRWLSHQNPVRLEAEAIRDAMLFASGELDPAMGGPHPFPPVASWGFTQHAPFTAVYETRQRSIYLMQQRIRKDPFLALFDGSDPNTSTAERTVSTTPLQSLFLMNDPFAHAQARKLAERLLAEPGTESRRIDQAYRICFGRPASAVEQQEAQAFLAAARAAHGKAGASPEDLEPAAWASFTRALMSTNEFVMLD